MSAVSVVGSTASLARRAARSLESHGLSVASTNIVGEDCSLADALDAAARHPTTACVLVLAHEITGHVPFATVCRAASPHVPIVFVPAADLSGDVHLRPWLRSIGVLEVGTLGEALDALPAVTTLDFPGGNTCLAVGEDAVLLAASAISVGRAGFTVDYRVGHALTDALARLEHDLVLMVIEEPDGAPDGLAASIAAARSAHPELPLLLVADGTPLWRSTLERYVDAGSVCVVGPTVDLSVGLACLADWERVRNALSQPRPRPRDASRLRRVTRAMSVESAAGYSPATQADLIGALGLPYARSTRVGYLEDALIAAAELGYPLRLAAIHAQMRLPEEPAWVSVLESSQLMRIAEAELSRANRSLGLRAELILAEAQRAATTEIRVHGVLHPDYGIVVRVSADAESVVVIPPMPMDPERLLSELGLPVEHTTLRAAIADGVRSAHSALAEVSSISELTLSLDIGPTGFSVRHAMISTEPQT